MATLPHVLLLQWGFLPVLGCFGAQGITTTAARGGAGCRLWRG
ncbi:hypothetical protein ARTSIC4J27_3265 [Pseudarthrobacter siccitolerans]|uniref:Uncharacterized protein n=1 Tax=Pseudarthrobacter siccitolerans TaxID=861266 RepID=A0A024H529_9MICC|nr:hypothetical protein ARTSIC4J27_3265 [Pseudarthrobacter siccitolerans]